GRPSPGLYRRGIAQVAHVAPRDHAELLAGQAAFDLVVVDLGGAGGALAADGQDVQADLGADRRGDFAHLERLSGGLELRREVGDLRLAQVAGDDAGRFASGGFERGAVLDG